MTKLLSTTALVLALGFPAVTFAQTTTTNTDQSASNQSGEQRGFLANRSQSDVLASDLMGKDVYARRNAAGEDATGGQATDGQATGDQANTNTASNDNAASGQAMGQSNGMRNMQSMNRADLDQMDNIGQVNEIILSSDGKVRALVIGVGGFLGMGEHDAAVTMDQVTFASDAEDRSEMYIVVNTSAKMLENSPAYDRTAMQTDHMQGSDGSQGDRADVNAESRTERSAFNAPDVSRDGYNRVEVSEVSAEMLDGKSVYDMNEDSVGSIDDLILDDQGAITNVIIDFGGFLGIGSSQVSVGFEELTILSNEGRSDVRVYIDATKEQIQAQPQYRGAERASN